MATGLKRMSFVVTPEIEKRLDITKKERFYDRSQSEMIRMIILAGLNSIAAERIKQSQSSLEVQE